jgi:beta-galactosidase
MKKTFTSASQIHLGASYYPEHWEEHRWSEDIRLMKEAGLTVVRMAEFAWSSMEPAAGDFHFEWLEKAISMLAEAGILTVLGTPTAAPPTWLVQRFPDLLAVTEQGQRLQVGNRCHYCVTSSDFHAAAARIVSAMGERFGSNPNVIGWQFDNEFHRVCYCERCQKKFQEYLEQRYGSLDTLNKRWSTRYWSQTYTAWEQIPIPIGPHNPGLMLAFKHFTTENYRSFQRLQIDNLQPYLPENVWMTHNFMQWFDGYDHYILSEDLDIASWDWYVGMGHHDFLSSGVHHDLIRGFKNQNFWLIETQPASINWKPINNTLNKGETRAMAWHAIAHGADAILYWQWRSALGGQEQLHGTIVDQSGQPRPFYEEVQQLGRDLKSTSDLLAGSVIQASVAMLNDYDSLWAIQWQPHHRDFDYVKHFTHYYRPLALMNVPVDVISAKGIKHNERLKNYRLIIAPTLWLLDERTTASLQDYVFQGGHLVLTIRCGMKDQYNALLPKRQPGDLAKIAGIEVDEFYALQDPIPVIGNFLEGQSILWAERLRKIDNKKAIVMAKYGKSNGWLDGQTAITVHRFGKGLVYYVGAYLDDASQQTLLNRILKTAAVTTITTPPGIELCTRQRLDGEKIYIVINHKPIQNMLRMPWPVYDHLTKVEHHTEINLAPYGIAVFTTVKE